MKDNINKRVMYSTSFNDIENVIKSCPENQREECKQLLIDAYEDFYNTLDIYAFKKKICCIISSDTPDT